MTDTIGSLVDKLATVNNKMFFNQEFLYEIGRMTEDDFVMKYYSDGDKRDLYNSLKKVISLNLQRQSLILEHDKFLVDMILDLIANPNNKDKYIIDQFKTQKPTANV